MGCVSSAIHSSIAARKKLESISTFEELCRLVAHLRPFELSGVSAASPADADAVKLQQVMSKNRKLLSSVKSYLNYVIFASLESLTGIKHSLDKAHAAREKVIAILQCFQKEDNKKRRKKRKNNKYLATVAKLKELNATGDPFAKHPEELRMLLDQQRVLMTALRERKHDLKKKFGWFKLLRKASGVIYTAAFVAVLVGSVVVAAVAAPAAAVTAATSAAMKALEAWLDSLWEEGERAFEGEKGVIAAMRKGGFVVEDLENIRLLVEKLKIDFGSVSASADFALQGAKGTATGVRIGMKEIASKIEEVEVGINGLQERVESLISDIHRQVDEFLRTIITAEK